MKYKALCLWILLLLVISSVARAAQLASDNFPGTTLSSNWTTTSGAFSVASGIVTGNSAYSENTAYYNAISWPSNQYSEAAVANGDSATDFVGVIVRASGTNSSNESYYGFSVSGYETNSPQMILVKDVLGSITVLAMTSTYYHLSDGEIIEITVQGTTISGYLGGVLILTATDSSISSGSAGIYAENNIGQLETWSGGSTVESTSEFFFGVHLLPLSPLNANAGEFSPDTPTITVSATASQPNTIWSALCLEADNVGTPTPTTGTQDALGWTFGGSQDAAVSSHLVSTASGSMSASFTLETSADDAYAVIAIFNAATSGGASNILVDPNGHPLISYGSPVISQNTVLGSRGLAALVPFVWGIDRQRRLARRS